MNKEYKRAGLSFWQYPPYLFIIFAIILVSFITFIASTFILNSLASFVLIIFTILLFIIFGYLILINFNRVANENKMKSEFISIASHQLRTPLVNFRWTLEALIKRARGATPPENLVGSLDNLYVMSGHMLYAIRALLDLAGNETGIRPLNITNFSLSDFAMEEVESFKASMGNKDISIDFEPQDHLPMVQADREQISMVTKNFIDNAIRYTTKGEVISVSVEKADDLHLRLSVFNPGKEIPENQRKYIFNKYFHSYAGTSETDSKGSGIGLYVAKSIIEMSGGEIGFNSQEGIGTSFWFTLPISQT